MEITCCFRHAMCVCEDSGEERMDGDMDGSQMQFQCTTSCGLQRRATLWVSLGQMIHIHDFILKISQQEGLVFVLPLNQSFLTSSRSANWARCGHLGDVRVRFLLCMRTHIDPGSVSSGWFIAGASMLPSLLEMRNTPPSNRSSDQFASRAAMFYH